ncbi:hypothetical protein HPB47_005427 [Ixodes persulcatus]|uniref:Uncharacterized protein n=1 Tax=Ixodes persulcatus TaxID=34615 RepID=A0AC60PDV0_IXOPE|nr:hypothetical protein HPB47_005427 [Ixodes persulcatus]
MTRTSSTNIGTKASESSVVLDRLGSVLTNDVRMVPDDLILGHSRYQLPPAQYAHMSPEAWKNSSIPLEEQGRYSQCTMYDPPDGPSNATRKVVECVQWDYDLSPGEETMVSQWNLVCGDALDLPVIVAYIIVADMLSIPVIAQVSDKAGRRNVIYACVVFAAVTWGAVYFATSYVLFTAGRIFLSIALSTLRMNTLILLFEVTTPGYRDCFISAAHLGVALAMTSAAMLDCATVSKRTVLTVGMIPTALFVLAVGVVDESPRLLATRWEFDRVNNVLRWMYRVNGTSFTPPPLKNHFHGQAKRSVPRPSSAALRNRTILVGGVWFCLICSYYASWQLSPKICDVTLLLVISLYQVSTAPVSCVLLRLYGRKTSLSVVCVLSGGLACVQSVSVILPDYMATILRHLTLSTILLNFFLCYVYTLELYPTVMRTMGVCTAMLCGKLGSIVSFFVRDQSKVHPSVPDILIAALMIGAMVLLSWLPETKYTKVPDTLYDVETQVVRGIVIKMFQK